MIFFIKNSYQKNCNLVIIKCETLLIKNLSRFKGFYLYKALAKYVFYESYKLLKN